MYTYSNGGASIYEYALQVIDEDGKNLTYKKKFGRVTEVVDLSYSSKMGTSGFYEMNYAEAVLLTLLREEDKEEFIVAQNANIGRLRDRTFEIIEYIGGTAGEYVFIYESPAE